MSSTIPAIPDDFQKIFEEAFTQYLKEAWREFLEVKLPAIQQHYQQKITDELKTAQPGDKLYGLDVINLDPGQPPTHPDLITLQKRFSDLKVPLVEGLKVGSARVALTIHRSVNLTSDKDPIVDIYNGLYSFAIEVDLKRPNYSIALGGGEEQTSTYHQNQYLVEVKWDAPSLYLRLFLTTSSTGGFLLDGEIGLPVAIPLGATMMGLKGVKLLYGERFAPKLNGSSAKNAIAKMAEASAEDYVSWATLSQLDQWIPVPIEEDLHVYGIAATVVDMSSSGAIVSLLKAGLSYISYGPTIMIGGDVLLLDTIDAYKVCGAIDIPSQSLFVRVTETFPLFPEWPDIVSLQGEVAVKASLIYPLEFQATIGGKDLDGCTVKIWKFLQLYGGVRITPFHGAAFRAGARVAGEMELCGFGAGINLAINIDGQLGWNPIQVSGDMSVSGGVWIEVFGERLGLGIGGKLEIKLPKPVSLKLSVEFTLSLPWPLSDLHFPVNVFDFHDPEVGQAKPTLKMTAQALSFMHGPSGIVDELTVKPSKTLPEVWPDVTFIVPFQRIAGVTSNIPTQILNREVGDGNQTEGGIHVTHNFSDLKIEKLDPITHAATVDTSVKACWLYLSGGGNPERSSRLAIPCSDPLGWLNRFTYAQPGSALPAERMVFQTFGLGPAERIEPNTGTASKRFEDVVVSSHRSYWLQPVSWADSETGYRRTIIARRFSIQFSQINSAGTEILPVKRCDIRTIGTETSILRVNGVEIQPIFVKTVHDNVAEWSYIIERTQADWLSVLELDGGEGFLNIAAIGYVVEKLALIDGWPTTVLAPGDYRLTMNGTSMAAGATGSPWDPIIRDFRVIAPPLRPYIKYATNGDERLFRLEVGGWNPNPAGLGFGHYQEHFGLVRSRVGYLSTMYPELWVSPRADVAPQPVSVVQNAEGTLAGSKISQQWHAQTGGQASLEEEFLFLVPPEAGFNKIQIYGGKPSDGIAPVDSWSYRVSQFANSIDHLRPVSSKISRLFGPFGSRTAEVNSPPNLPAAFDFDAVPTAILRAGWALPSLLRNLTAASLPDNGISFLRMLDWCGVFDTDPSFSGEGVLDAVNKTDMGLLFDRGRSAVGLIIRTPEPCDWRRVKATIVTGANGAFTEMLETSLLASTDGCSCLLIAKIADVPIRLPRGIYAMRLQFKLEAPFLPRLTRVTNPSLKIEETGFSFELPYGNAW